MPRFNELEQPAGCITQKEVRPALDLVIGEEVVDTALNNAKKGRLVTRQQYAIVEALGYGEKGRRQDQRKL